MFLLASGGHIGVPEKDNKVGIRFSYKHCNFSRVCLLVKIASKTVTRSILSSALAREPASFWRENMINVVILQRVLVKMSF